MLENENLSKELHKLRFKANQKGFLQASPSTRARLREASHLFTQLQALLEEYIASSSEQPAERKEQIVKRARSVIIDS